MEQTKEKQICPYCLSAIEENDEYILCPACGVAHHHECWQTNGKCSVYGCDGFQAWDSDIAGRIAPKLKGDVNLDSDDLEVAPRAYAGPVCIECGRRVRRGQLTCLKCRTKNTPLYQGCFGTGVLFIGGFIALITLLLKGLG